MKLIATYGSLRVRGYNYMRSMGRPLWEGKMELPYEMRAVSSFPAIIESDEKHNIYLEVFVIPDDAFIGIHAMERGAGYIKTTIKTEVGMASMWVWEKEHANGYGRNAPIIEDGDYIKWYHSRLE